MDERSFIEQKKASWDLLSESVEQVKKHGIRSLSGARLSSLGAGYRAVVSDLAFARAQGASSSLVSYLNDLAGRAHGVIYAAESAKLKGIKAFTFYEFPGLFRSSSRYVLTAALIFFAAWATAAYIIQSEPGSVNAFVPERFISKDAGDHVPFVPDPAGMSSFIMTNNITVGILTFAGGITAGLYTIYMLFQNGLLIGAILVMALSRMGHLVLWSYILPHGIIELMAIFICGGAGLMIGSAFIAPGNLKRADAIRIAAGKALRLFAGAISLFVIAALIEGFLTPSRISPWSKLAFAGVTALGLVAYLGFAGRDRATAAQRSSHADIH